MHTAVTHESWLVTHLHSHAHMQCNTLVLCMTSHMVTEQAQFSVGVKAGVLTGEAFRPCKAIAGRV